ITTSTASKRTRSLSMLRSLTADHLRAGAAAARRPIAQEFLQALSRVHLGRINVPGGIHADLMQVMEIAGHPASASTTSRFVKILGIEGVGGLVGVVADVEAALSFVGREVHGQGCAGHFGLRIRALADESPSKIAPLARLAVRIAARLAQ